jgi:hypothetical protein
MHRTFLHIAATEIGNHLHISDEIAANVKCVYSVSVTKNAIANLGFGMSN